MNAAPLFIFVIFFLFGITICEEVRAEQFQYDSHGKRDPFLSEAADGWGAGEFVYGELQLEGIISDAGGASAMINGEMVSAGDSFAGFEVLSVEPNRVQLAQEGEIFDLYLRQEEEEGPEDSAVAALEGEENAGNDETIE